MSLNPIRLKGNWDKGYALDAHIIKSTYLGEDEYGHNKFDTTRSMIGELVYQLKYKNKTDKIYDIIELINPFLQKWHDMKTVDIVIPAPPSKKYREVQPVHLIAKMIAKLLNVPYVNNLLEKLNSGQSKDKSLKDKTESIKGTIIKHKQFKKDVNILVVDDLYDSGTTLNEVCNVLKKDKHVNKIFVLAMTKTKR